MLHSVDALTEQARELALRLLDSRPRTKAQLRVALQEFPEPVIEGVIERLDELGLINESEHARAIVSRKKLNSKAALRRGLDGRGFEKIVIERLAAEITEDQELQAATAAASKRFRQLKGFEPEVRKRRLIGFLQRRGYSSQVVFAAISEAEANAVKSEP